MEFYLPTRLYIEKDCINKYGHIMKDIGKHAFIVTGKSSRVNGSLNDMTAMLDKLGIKYYIFDETGENPSIETVMTARNTAIEFGADFVIGIGGGSPLDAAKAVALMAKKTLSGNKIGSEVLYQKISLEHLPVVEVPTTAGTGSEVTQYSILTIHEKRTKKSISHSIFPKIAFNDPQYLKTLSHSKLIDTSVDTLAHLIESYLSAKSQNGLFCERGLSIWGSLKTKIKTNTLDDENWEMLMQASALGGMAIAHTSTSIPHGLSYKVTYELGIPHGKACGMFLGGYLENYPDKEKSNDVLNCLGFNTAKEFKEYLIDILKAEPLDKKFSYENALALSENKEKLANHPYNITVDELLKTENLIN